MFNSRARGGVMVEYTVVTMMLILLLWYVLFGGSGYWLDPDKTANQGNLSSSQSASPPPDSVINLLNDRQHEFADDIYQP